MSSNLPSVSVLWPVPHCVRNLLQFYRTRMMDNPFPREVLWYSEIDDSMNIKEKASILLNNFL